MDHPEPKGRKVVFMLTLKELKKIVKVAENLDNPYRDCTFVAPKGEMTAEKKKLDAWRNNADKAGHCEPSRISPC